MLNTAEYLRPLSVEEAAASLGQKDAALLAGGTDFIPLLKLGLKTPRRLILLSGLSELKGVHFEGNTVTLRACTTVADVAEHPRFVKDVPALSDAALAVASPQIRNRGTVGGNLFQDRRCLYFNQSEFWRSSIKPCFKTGGSVCHQIPNSSVCRAFYYSDMATALLALDSEAVVLASGGVSGERKAKKFPLEEVIDKHLILNGGLKHEDALLTEVRFPVPRFSCFVKFAPRASFDFPLLNLAAVKNDEGWRVFAGGWGTRAGRLPRTEKALAGGAASEEMEQVCLKELKDRREAVREAGLSPKMRELLPLRSCFVKIRSALNE